MTADQGQRLSLLVMLTDAVLFSFTVLWNWSGLRMYKEKKICLIAVSEIGKI